MFAQFRVIEFILSFDGRECRISGDSSTVSINPAHVVSIEDSNERGEIRAAAPTTIQLSNGRFYRVDVTRNEAARLLANATLFARLMDAEGIEHVWPEQQTS